MPLIGFLHGGSAKPFAHHEVAFRKGLAETGHVEGKNLAFEFRWADGQDDRLPALAADLVQRRAALIATGGGSRSAFAAKSATASIPIVFTTGGDPIKLGLVTSLSRPTANVTGVIFFGSALGPKPMELLRELVPKAAAIAVLVNPGNPTTEGYLKDVHAGARATGVEIKVLLARTAGDLDIAFASMVEKQVHGLLVGGDALFVGNRKHLVALAARYAIPTIYLQREYVEDGGLMSYGNSQTDAYREIGVYAGRILKGEKVSDLPVTQPTKFEFTLNLKTAKALGLTIPATLLATADDVVE